VFDLLGQPDVDFPTLASAFPWLHEVPTRALSQVRTEARYHGYLARQEADVAGFRREEALRLEGVRFSAIAGLSGELSTKLTDLQPASLGAASRIQGMTPAGLAAIAAHLRKQRAEQTVP